MKKLFLFGSSGKMGKEISNLLSQSKEFELTEEIEESDVVVDFTNHKAFSENLAISLKNKKPFISGTTGLNQEQFDSLKIASETIPVLWSSNMSLGVCVLNQMLKNLKSISEYDFYIEETHHAQKKDAPSGTALTIQKNLESVIEKKAKDTISLRGGGVFGQHRVIALGPEETLLIQHDALNRTVFARGALICAKWILNKKPGNYSLEDVLK
jgi:4-hydroxy-tetrahydrodipicolinate reductase